MKKRPFVITFAQFFFLGLLLASLRSVEGDAGAAGDEASRSADRRIVDLVNNARLKGMRCGNTYYKATRPVAWNGLLAGAAGRHSGDLAGGEDLGHTGSDGSGPGERIMRMGYRWMTYGENVCEGYATPEEAVSAWLRSPGHCENIMNPAFREAGAAHAKGPKGTCWTLVLAAPEVSPPGKK